MPRTRHILNATIVIGTLTFLAISVRGTAQLTQDLITITAIDHWHPNWPGTAAATSWMAALSWLAPLAALLALAGHFIAPRVFPHTSHPSGAIPRTTMVNALGTAGLAIASVGGVAGFRRDLIQSLTESGADDPASIADAAMELATTDDPSDWATEVRQKAMTLAGMNGSATTCVLHSMSISDIAASGAFLRRYGYQAFRTTRHHSTPGAHPAPGGSLNFSGLVVFHRTHAQEAEGAMIELLLAAHDAYLAASSDNGTNAQRTTDAVERLRYVTTKLALVGFIPPELDAEVGHAGIATADELEQWAVAQVVAVCSPLSTNPLPTVEIGAGGAL